MKVMYLAPRFHTNQSAVVKGWIERGDEVKFVSYYSAIIEDYTELVPDVLGFSPVYELFDWLYVNVIKRNDLNAITFKIKHGFPPVFKLRKLIRDFKPDILIVRERTLYSIAAYGMSDKKRTLSILYNQSPLWEKELKTDWKHKLIYKITPKYRMTPVLGKKEGNQINENSFFVPFIVEPQLSYEKKEYFKNNCINVLLIGKFEPRKHHMMLMDVLKEIRETVKDDIKLTVIGEATTRQQLQFLKTVEEHVKSRNYESFVTIKTNVPKAETNKIYADTDVFVIPSTREMASISQLEAMSFSIPVICSEKNGSACYVKDGYSGFLFEDCNAEDLKLKLLPLLQNRNKIKEMGKQAYQEICQKYTFENYLEGIQKIMEKSGYDKK